MNQTLQTIKGVVVQYGHRFNGFTSQNIQWSSHFDCAVQNYTVSLSVIGIILLFLIAACFKCLNKGKKSMTTFMAELVDVQTVTHDTKIFTFMMPKNMKKIGLKIGEHLQVEATINGQLQSRKYTPVSRPDLKSQTFKLLIKVYHPIQRFPQGGLMSQHIQSMKLHDKIKVTLPYGKFNYLGNLNTLKINLDKSQINKKYKHMYMIAGGTGITPLYQIIQYVSQVEGTSGPSMTVLFANRSEDDILLKSQLEGYMKMNSKFTCNFSVDNAINKETWKGLTGFVSLDKVKQTMKSDVSETVFLVCGPPVLCNLAEKFYGQMGAKEKQIHRF